MLPCRCTAAIAILLAASLVAGAGPVASEECVTDRNATKVALILRLSSSSGERLSDDWMAIACASIVAIKHANARDGRVVPHFADIPRSRPQLIPIVADSRSDASGSVTAYSRVVRQQGATAVVGPARSASSTPVAVLQAVHQVPSVSHWASSPRLSDQAVYPYFSRVFPQDDVFGLATVGMIRSLGWRHFSLLRVDDGFGAGMEEALTEYAQGQGVVIDRISLINYAATPQEIDTAVTRLAGGSNLIVLVVFDSHLPSIVESAHRLRLLEPGYAWLVLDTPTVGGINVLYDAEPQRAATLASRAVGFNTLTFTLARTPGHARLTDVWPTLTPDDCANEEFDAAASLFSSEPPLLTAFAYDAAAMVALAMTSDAALAGGTPEALNAAVRATSFDGASGQVELLPGLGDRDPTNLKMSISSWEVDPSSNRLVASPRATLSLRNGTAEVVLIDDSAPLTWPGGVTATPVDRIKAADEAATREAASNNRAREILVIVVACIGPFVLGYCTFRCVRSHRRHRRLNQQNEERLQRNLRAALKTTSDFEFAASLVRATDFIALGELKQHEELRDRGLLQFHERLDELIAAPLHLLFFSHQWTSWQKPDPTGQQYKTAVAALHEVLKAEGWELANTWVWCDYLSIPQRSRGMQKLAIDSLSAYASVAHAFVIIAPPVQHSDTHQECNVETYNKRMWCRAENLCHSLSNGVGAMWLASAVDKCERMTNDVSFLESNLRVMQGDSTVEEDKLSLTLPILGLCAAVMAAEIEWLEEEAIRKKGGEKKGDQPKKGDHHPNSPGGHASASVLHRIVESSLKAKRQSQEADATQLRSYDPRAVLRLIEGVGIEEIFPPTLRLASGKEVELFGPLVPMMKQLLLDEPETRKELLKNMGRHARRGKTIKGATALGRAWRGRASTKRLSSVGASDASDRASDAEDKV